MAATGLDSGLGEALFSNELIMIFEILKSGKSISVDKVYIIYSIPHDVHACVVNSSGLEKLSISDNEFTCGIKVYVLGCWLYTKQV